MVIVNVNLLTFINPFRNIYIVSSTLLETGDSTVVKADVASVPQNSLQSREITKK